MKKILVFSAFCVLAHKANAQSVTAAQVNGTWATSANEFKIWALKFAHGKLVVTQTGVCGFGNRATAEGVYKKASTRKPAFDFGDS